MKTVQTKLMLPVPGNSALKKAARPADITISGLAAESKQPRIHAASMP